ncbi:MAG: DUF2330 domain-containing protein [Myxococcales bacterium]|nr:DUF2330 domain-containing protein [Myxococcales bacterium]
MASAPFHGHLAALSWALATVLSVVLVPTSAHACGGFFCSQAAPVNQAAEEILFVDHGDGSITGVIEIRYEGPSKRFAWLLPVPGDPDIALSSTYAFSRLRAATSPQYELDVEIEGECKPEPPSLDAGAVFDERAESEGVDAKGGVTVVSSGEVGPYEFHVISLDDSLPEPADAAIEWLGDNGYDVTATAPELLGPYLADGLNLLAVKLTKGTDSGSIRPLMVTYEGDRPMIPIRPTSVAAMPDMGIQVYVAGAAQAVPVNYKSLILNEALIDWFFWQRNYADVVTAAADEAGGHGFVTEFGGDSGEFEGMLFGELDQQNWDRFSEQQFSDGFEAIEAVQWIYRSWDGWRDAIRAAVTLPMSVSFDDFGRNPDAYRDVAEVDVQVFRRELWEGVVKPVAETQKLVTKRPYLTRLFTSMSPQEMTEDPVFGFNPDLMDVSRFHRAQQTIKCSPELNRWEAPWVIELPQGGVITGEGGRSWPIEVGDGVPAALQVIDVNETGGGMVSVDNREMVDRMLEAETGMPQRIKDTPATPQPSEAEDQEGKMPLGGEANLTDTDNGADAGVNDPSAGAMDDTSGLFCSLRAPGLPGSSAMGLLLLAFAVVLLRRV